MPKGKGRPSVTIGSKRNVKRPPRKQISGGEALRRVAEKSVMRTAHRAPFALAYEMGRAAEIANKAVKKRERKLLGKTGKKSI